MDGLKTLGLWTAAAAFVSGIVGWSRLVALANANSGLASWVQAIGSILAILASGLIAAWQLGETRRSTEKAEHLKSKALMDTICTLAHALSMQTASLGAGFKNRGGAEAFRTHSRPEILFAEIEYSARALPLHELPDAEAIELVVKIQQLISSTRLVIATILRLLTEGPIDPYSTMEDPLAMQLAAAKLLDRRARELAARLG